MSIWPSSIHRMVARYDTSSNFANHPSHNCSKGYKRCSVHCHLQTHISSLQMCLVVQQNQRLSYDALSAYQIAEFFTKYGLTTDKIDHFLSTVLYPPHQYKVQSAILCLETRRLRSSSSDTLNYLWDNSRLQDNFMEILFPNAGTKGVFGLVHVYTANIVSGVAFCRVGNDFFSPAPRMEQCLLQTIQRLRKI